MKKKTILDILSSKKKKKLVCTTAYTYVVSHIVSEAEFDIILIGDSLGTTLQGQNSTIPVTLEQMIYHSQIVVRGNTGSFIVTDMPFLTTDVSRADSIRNAGKVIQETGKTSSELSDAISKDLKKHGMKFVGTTVVYAYLQAIGVIWSHEDECFCSRVTSLL